MGREGVESKIADKPYVQTIKWSKVNKCIKRGEGSSAILSNYLIFLLSSKKKKKEAVYEPAAFFTVSIKAQEGFQILGGSNMTNLQKCSP